MSESLKKSLFAMFSQIPVKVINEVDITKTEITGISYDSRNVHLGNLFVALRGGSIDGHFFIPAAIEKGASAVLGSEEIKGLAVPYLRVVDPRFALAHLSASFYDFPARKMTMIGVTGTDGKTTTTNLIYQILLAAGLRVGIVSTVNAVIGDEVVDTGLHVTTPEAPEVQYFLHRMHEVGMTHVILEATSHGLAQHRVTACEFDIAIITNITHEHLDYHGSFEAYRQAKGRLFSQLSTTSEKSQGNIRLGILNHDDPSYLYLLNLNNQKNIAYGLTNKADIYAEDIVYGDSATSFMVRGNGFAFPVKSHLVGTYNIQNCLAAITAALEGLHIQEKYVQAGIDNLGGVSGRWEQINLGQKFMAVVDFAHTPNALKEVLKAARQITKNRVIVVFGSAGLRDREKRRLMAEVGIELADFSILTAEDPRTEDLDEILKEMSSAAERKGGLEGKNFKVVRDRSEAIRQSVRLAGKGDVVLCCGKGHERSMCFGVVEYPWDEHIALQAALTELLEIPGPKMPLLPTQAK